MILTSENSSPYSLSSQEDVYKYKDTLVKIITVFHDYGKEIALVEDEEGNLFEVNKSYLH